MALYFIKAKVKDPAFYVQCCAYTAVNFFFFFTNAHASYSMRQDFDDP